jgi:hypothetical protein
MHLSLMFMSSSDKCRMRMTSRRTLALALDTPGLSVDNYAM